MSSDDNFPVENEENDEPLVLLDDEQDGNNDDDDSFIPPQEDLEQEQKNEKSFDLAATIKAVIAPLIELPSIAAGVISSLTKKSAKSDEGESTSDGQDGEAPAEEMPQDAAFAFAQEDDAPAENEESDDSAQKKGKQKKEKKEKPAKEKKEKPVKSKKDSEDGQEEAAPGEKKKIPTLVWVIVILLLVPGNALFIMNFLSSDRSGNDGFPHIDAPIADIDNEQGVDLPVDDNIVNINTNFDENDLFYLIGASHQEVVEALGRPEPESRSNIMLYGRLDEDKFSLEVSLENNSSVTKIRFFAGHWTMCGLRPVNSLSRINRALGEIGMTAQNPVRDSETEDVFHEFNFNYNNEPFTLLFTVSPDGNCLTLTGTAQSQQIGDGDGDEIDGDGNDGLNVDDSLSADEVNLVQLVGRSSDEVTLMIGEPTTTENTQSGYSAWNYGAAGDVYLTLGIYRDRVFYIKLLDSRHSIFGIECGENVIDARTRLMVSLGFVYSGEYVFDGMTQIPFKHMYNGITVMVVLTASEDGRIAEISFMDVAVAQSLEVYKIADAPGGNGDENIDGDEGEDED